MREGNPCFQKPQASKAVEGKGLEEGGGLNGAASRLSGATLVPHSARSLRIATVRCGPSGRTMPAIARLGPALLVVALLLPRAHALFGEPTTSRPVPIDSRSSPALL